MSLQERRSFDEEEIVFLRDEKKKKEGRARLFVCFCSKKTSLPFFSFFYNSHTHNNCHTNTKKFLRTTTTRTREQERHTIISHRHTNTRKQCSAIARDALL